MMYLVNNSWFFLFFKGFFFFLFIFVIVILVYALLGIFLSRLNALVNGKGTMLAWVPICNIYLLGKLAVNKVVGWILVIGTFLVGIMRFSDVPSESISSIVFKIYNIIILGLFIYAVIKYFKLNNNQNNINM